MGADRSIFRIAGSQLGLLTRSQALHAGVTDDQIGHRLRSGSLEAVYRGVYRTPGSTPSFAQSALAACLACGARAVASHQTAGALFRLLEAPTGPIEVTVPSSHCRRPTGVVVHRSCVVERARIGTVPVTSIGRTLLDLAGAISTPALETAVDEAFRIGLTTPTRLLGYVDSSGRGRIPGSGSLRELARDRIEGVPESVLEGAMLHVIRAYRLPEPVRQHEVNIGGRTVRFDFAYPDPRLAIELDGRAPHWGRERWQSDHDRHNATEAAGWRTLRFTWWDVTERCSYVALAVADGLGLRPARWRAVRGKPSRIRP